MVTILLWTALAAVIAFTSATVRQDNFKPTWAVLTLAAIGIFCLLYSGIGLLLLYFTPVALLGWYYHQEIKEGFRRRRK